MNKKSERDAELHRLRGGLMVKYIAHHDSIKVAYLNNDITKLKAAAERMIKTLVDLIDPQVNDDKRGQLVAVLKDVMIDPDNASVDWIQSDLDIKNILQVSGDFDLDKLVNSVVWLRNAETVELEQVK